MRRDSHHEPAPSHDAPGASRTVTAQSRRCAGRSSAALLVGLFGLAALPFGACVDKDTTDLTPLGGSGGSGGSAGRGNAGSAGRGNAGSAGRGGAAGAAGAAGAGMSGNGGSSGSTGGTGDIPDGGLAPDGGDAAVPLVGRPAFATAICARFEEVADPCDPAGADCVASNVAGWGEFETASPGCSEEIDAYFGCIADEPITSFICEESTNNPAIAVFANGCPDEEAAFILAEDNCGEPR